MESRIEKAFDFAQEVAKQLIALATGIIALTITFLTDVAEGGAGELTALRVAWVLFLVSVVLGAVTLMALSGNLERPHGGVATPSIYSRNITLPASLQVLTFLAALVCTIWFGFSALT
ncbi:hypothetical protein [Cellulomonas sp.]|uniref:hypothetical protein n=1 Tax=Cellulomonas sp. TaxID=40001 RepID=UPI003BA981E2